MLVCQYCPDKPAFRYKGELTLHLAHVHRIYSESYYQVIQHREETGYYGRQIAYWKKRR